jgi:hypothetical protein
MLNKPIFKGIFVLMALSSSITALADHRSSNGSSSFDSSKASIFYTYESNGDDYIAGIGAGVTFKDSHTKFGFGLTTSINNAEVIAEDGFIEDYVAWEASARIGYFSNLSIYGEVGIDLTELLFHDLRYDHHDDYYNEYHDDIDAYVGIGAGIKLGALRIEAFSRLREIDSRYWEARSSHFTGVQFSLNF